jgi:hypothetical protein
MLKQKRWDIIHSFERKQKESFLNTLTTSESLKILSGLYRFIQKISDRKYYRRLDIRKIQVLSKVHSMFMKVKL